MIERASMLLCICLLGCGPKPEPAAAPPPEPSAAPQPSSAPPPEPAPVEAEPVATSTAPAEPPPPPAPSIHDVCFSMCDKVKAKCNQGAFESCRVNCSKYDPPPEGCDDVVRDALACARDAADLVCANVAPESCAKRFRRIAACAAGEKPVSSEPTPKSLPPGFAMYENTAAGLHAPMPEGVTAGQGDVLATAKHSSGAVYSIRKLPRPEGKLSEKQFLRVGMNLLGRCSDKMKMGGMVDKPGRTSINYNTKCPDGSLEQGLFWATDQALFVAQVRGPGPDLGPSETFLYGFEAK